MKVDKKRFEEVFRGKAGEFKSSVNIENIFEEFKAKVTQL